jgi:hypothetical protein
MPSTAENSEDLPAAGQHTGIDKMRRYHGSQRKGLKQEPPADRSGAMPVGHMQLVPTEFAMGNITRVGRINIGRLRKLSPRFVERYQREHA